MFKWDRLLRKNKIKNYVKYMEREDGGQDTSLHPDHTTKNHEEGNKGTDEYEVVEIEILPKKIICPDCGGITLEGMEFCDKCGGEL